MKDEHTPVVPNTPITPPTGDATSRLPGILMIAASVVISAVLLINRKRKDDKE